MFQICIPDKKIQGKKTMLHFLKWFLNAMIRNTKIHNIHNIIRFSKSMQLNKCIH
jgi:hypothetical protein